MKLLPLLLLLSTLTFGQRKALLVIVDGIPADVIEKVETPNLNKIAKAGGYHRAFVGGLKGSYSQSPTVSAVGYNHALTGVWSNKHNVWDNDIKEPNYNYWTFFRFARSAKPNLTTAIFSTWEDNRTKLLGEDLSATGNLKLDYTFDGYELDTVRFPHRPDRKFISDIDDFVTEKAVETIRQRGPDVSWVYLEFTDDMGHKFGDSPPFYDAVVKADAQLGKIWSAIEYRQKEFKEEWLIVVTTDHGRDKTTGKNHGGQSERERTGWIATNYAKLNPRFNDNPAIVDIAPSILDFMQVPVPEKQRAEFDGISFIDKVAILDLQATTQNGRVVLTWKSVANENVEIFVSETNAFKTGGTDNYLSQGIVSSSKQTFTLGPEYTGKSFLKISVRAQSNWLNTWVQPGK